MLTIKIHYAEPKSESELIKSTNIFESCLFELSYMTNINVELRNEWPSFKDRRRLVLERRASPRAPLPLRNVEYDPPVIKFYQRGVSTVDPYIQFISFYHVLEFYFITVSDGILYNNLDNLRSCLSIGSETLR